MLFIFLLIYILTTIILYNYVLYKFNKIYEVNNKFYNLNFMRSGT